MYQIRVSVTQGLPLWFLSTGWTGPARLLVSSLMAAYFSVVNFEAIFAAGGLTAE